MLILAFHQHLIVIKQLTISKPMMSQFVPQEDGVSQGELVQIRWHGMVQFLNGLVIQPYLIWFLLRRRKVFSQCLCLDTSLPQFLHVLQEHLILFLVMIHLYLICWFELNCIGSLPHQVHHYYYLSPHGSNPTVICVNDKDEFMNFTMIKPYHHLCQGWG